MEKLGVEPFQLLIQIFNFVVMFLVLSKLLYKPILKVLDQRRKKIEEGLQYAEKMKEEMEKNDRKREEIISESKNQARKIIEEGKKSGRLVETEIIEKAHKEAEEIIAKGRSELALERIEMEKQLRGKTISIATNMVESILRQILDKNYQKEVINKKIKELEKIYK